MRKRTAKKLHATDHHPWDGFFAQTPRRFCALFLLIYCSPDMKLSDAQNRNRSWTCFDGCFATLTLLWVGFACDKLKCFVFSEECVYPRLIMTLVLILKDLLIQQQLHQSVNIIIRSPARIAPAKSYAHSIIFVFLLLLRSVARSTD